MEKRGRRKTGGGGQEELNIYGAETKIKHNPSPNRSKRPGT